MLHFESTGEGWQHFESEAWGRCRRLIEVLDDQLANRQIEFYDGGQVLMYDRRTPRDAYGMLMGLRFSAKPKWKKCFSTVRQMEAAEFDAVWKSCSVNTSPRRGVRNPRRRP